ncbi:hypothetical protein E4S40_10735 [Algoriphagus kandeliae]|uniref:Uncharacterized protein n=2 Tax=Algoriphagus kandeliae TaxID=2562278 RepID=A0A4Y9QPG7_9BACT|nr:hypothetical protein E4S40_10735 [Algoriphagus kandeliae]
MKVFLTGVTEVEPKLLIDIQKFLSKIGGPMEYQNLGVSDLSRYKTIFPEVKDFDTQDEFDFGAAIKFGQLLKFKEDIPQEDILVIFTKKKLGAPIEEFKTWFSYFDDNVIIVRDKELDFFPKSKWPFILSHQVVENLFQLLSGTTIKNASQFIHLSPKGCLNDFCSYPPQIEFKLRMAHICNDCLNIAYSNKIDPNVLRQIKDTIESVRTKLDNFGDSVAIEEFSPVVVSEKGKIFIEDREIQLQDLPKALYLFFLKKPGVPIQNQYLRNYKDDLVRIYSKIKRGGENGPLYKLLGFDERGEKTIGYLNTEALKNHRYNISKELKSKLGEAKTEFYQIKSWRKKVNNMPQFYNQIGIPEDLIQIPHNF